MPKAVHGHCIRGSYLSSYHAVLSRCIGKVSFIHIRERRFWMLKRSVNLLLPQQQTNALRRCFPVASISPRSSAVLASRSYFRCLNSRMPAASRLQLVQRHMASSSSASASASSPQTPDSEALVLTESRNALRVLTLNRPKKLNSLCASIEVHI